MEEDHKKGKAGEGSKKGTKEKDRMRRRRERGEWKTGEEEKGWKEFREKREEEREKRKEERKKKNKNRESSARDAPFSPSAFPSTELGNNITPIKGRLGKTKLPHVKGQQRWLQIFRRILSKDDKASATHLTQFPCT